MLGITNVSNAPSIVLKDTVAGDTLKPWASGSYNGYSYRCAIPITGVTTDMIAEVTFSQAQVSSGNYSPVCTTYNGGLYVYGKVNTQITIPSIIVHSIVESYYELDNTPTQGSTRAVTSGGVYNAMHTKQTGVFNLPTDVFPANTTGAFISQGGWCHVRIWGATPTTTFYDKLITSNLLPPIAQYGESKNTVENGANTVFGQIYTNGNSNGHAQIKLTATSATTIYVSLDYPVDMS